MASGAGRVAQGLLAALFPSNCRLCGAPLENISRLPVCPECIPAMQPISVGTCKVCGEGLAGLARSAEIQTCSACQEARPFFEGASAYAGCSVLLVDDVLTTDTTASECARVLRKVGGAEKVWVATVARTLKNTGTNFAAEPDYEIAAQAS